jgi:hypothetical protein
MCECQNCENFKEKEKSAFGQWSEGEEFYYHQDLDPKYSKVEELVERERKKGWNASLVKFRCILSELMRKATGAEHEGLRNADIESAKLVER